MADLIALAGPEAGPASGGTPDSLVVLVHGYGADGNDLIGLAPLFAEALPGTAFVSPHAPYPCGMAPFGRQWFDVWNEDPVSRLAEIRHAASILDAFIDERCAALGIAADRLALLGFSQGTMLSLFVAPRWDAPCAGVLGYSGRLEGADLLAAETVSRPPVVLVHGDSDELLPLHHLQRAHAALEECGFDVAAHVRPGLGHGIDEAGIEIGRRFLSSRLAG